MIHTSLAKVANLNGQPQRALEYYQRAFEVLPSSLEPKHLLTRLHDFTVILTDLGHIQHAITHYLSYEWMYEAAGSDFLKIRAAWLKARLALQGGAPKVAAPGFGWVKDAMAERQLYYDAALAGLDQALALARCERPAEVRKLAEELVPVFRKHGIEREARRALEQWVEAVRQQRTDEATVLTTIEQLKVIARTPINLDERRSA